MTPFSFPSHHTLFECVGSSLWAWVSRPVTPRKNNVPGTLPGLVQFSQSFSRPKSMFPAQHASIIQNISRVGKGTYRRNQRRDRDCVTVGLIPHGRKPILDRDDRPGTWIRRDCGSLIGNETYDRVGVLIKCRIRTQSIVECIVTYIRYSRNRQRNVRCGRWHCG